MCNLIEKTVEIMFRQVAEIEIGSKVFIPITNQKIFNYDEKVNVSDKFNSSLFDIDDLHTNNISYIIPLVYDKAGTLKHRLRIRKLFAVRGIDICYYVIDPKSIDYLSCFRLCNTIWNYMSEYKSVFIVCDDFKISHFVATIFLIYLGRAKDQAIKEVYGDKEYLGIDEKFIEFEKFVKNVYKSH